MACSPASGQTDPRKSISDPHVARCAVLQVFQRCDLDGNGTIDRKELGLVFQELEPDVWSNAKLDQLMSLIDTNHTGQIDFIELLDFLFQEHARDVFTGPSFNRRDLEIMEVSALREAGLETDRHWAPLLVPLRKGWVTLLDAAWLVDLADSGGILARRQDLPEEAFIDAEALRCAGEGAGGCLRIIVLSHPWLQPGHPDPCGETLGKVAQALQFYLAKGGPYGVLIDFTALPQEPRLPSKGEDLIFALGLRSLNVFYAHPRTVVFKVTTFPEGYPEGYTLPEEANVKSYPERGWTFTESAMSGFTKDYDFVLDLGKLKGSEANLGAFLSQCKAGREPPLTPAAFREQLETKTFTNRKSDFDKVATLYDKAFDAQFSTAEKLEFSNLGWGPKEVQALSRVIAASCFQVKSLVLDNNGIGKEGCRHLAESLKRNSSLLKLSLQDCGITDLGVKYIADALKVNSKLMELDMQLNWMKDKGCRYLAEALGTNTHVVRLYLRGNRISKAGARCLQEILREHPWIRFLQLYSNNIPDEVENQLREEFGTRVGI